MDNLEQAKDIYRRYTRRLRYHQVKHLVSIGDKQEHHHNYIMKNLIEMGQKIKALGCRIAGDDLTGHYVTLITQEWIDAEKAKETRLDALTKKMRNESATKEEKLEYFKELLKESSREYNEQGKEAS